MIDRKELAALASECLSTSSPSFGFLMITYPTASDYYKAVQVPARSFTTPRLQAAEFVWDSLGPTLARGRSAVVFQAAMDGSRQALRCYIRNVSSRNRYSALSAYLASRDLSPFLSSTTWIDAAIRVKGETWPVLQMDWIDGRTLNEYVDFLVADRNTAALATLAVHWRDMVALLQDSEFAHGDLQHGNVLVDQEGRLRLVDFDGVWIPQLAGQSPPTEYGHPNYQHPFAHEWNRWLDTFSALVIYLSLVALGKDPSLWLPLYDSKNLLFTEADFFPPFETQAWKQLAALYDPQINELVQRLQECCAADWVSDRSLEMTLVQPSGVPAPPPTAAERHWWETKPPVPQASGGADSHAGQPGWAEATSFHVMNVPPVVSAAASLPAPPPLSTPLSSAGTGSPAKPTTARVGGTWWTGSGTGSAQARTWSASTPGAPAPSAESSSQRLHPDRQERKQRSGLRERRPRPDHRRPRPPATRPQGTGGIYDNLVRRAFAETVHPGRLLFNPPNQMRLGQIERVEVRLTRTLTLDAELLEHLHGRGEPQLEEIPTAPLMAVTLKGDGFRITGYSDEEQIVTDEGLTMWEYDIRALKRGQQRLVTCVSLRIPVAGQPLEHKSIPVREATIDVQVGAPALVAYFIVGNWQWFIGTAIAIAAVLVAVLH
jgi:eukaryotic-like serine/threonine-protein kinase